MYENEAAHVRLGIEFLQVMTEEDYLLDPTFDVLDLERKLNEIQAETASSPICPLRPLTMMRRGSRSTEGSSSMKQGICRREKQIKALRRPI